MNSTTLLSTETFKNKISSRTFCDTNKIPYVICCVRVINGDKDIKSVPKGWMDWSYEKCCTYNKTVDARCQTLNVNLRNSKYMIIDIDLVEKLSYGLETFGNEWVSYSTRRKLPHLWRLKQEGDISPDATNINNDGIDLRYTNIFEDVNNFIYFNEETIPEFIIQDHPNPKIFAEKKLEVSVKIQTTDDQDHNKNIEFLDIINETYWTEFDSWKRLIMAISATFLDKNEAEKLALHFSAKSTGNFDEEAVLKLLETEPKTVSVGTIRYYAKKSDEVAFAEINAKYKKLKKDEKNIVKSDTNDNSITDDEHACKLMKQMYGDSIVRGVDTWYVHLPNATSWGRGEEYLKQLIMTSRFTKKSGDFVVPYSANTTGCNNIYKAMCSYPELFPVNENFINEINNKTKNKLFFKDKYWDFIEKKWFEITSDIIPIIFIKRNAPTFDFTPEDILEFKQSVLNMFSNEEDLYLYLRAKSRALAGCVEDKRFYVMKGVRDSGKGVLQEQDNASFGEYCFTFDLPMCKTNHKADASDRRWVLSSQAHIKRVGSSNEVACIAGKNELPIDGNEMKRVICSGGDTFKARSHYKDEIDATFNGTAFLAVNGIPSCNPPDALEKMILFDMPFKFVEKSMVGQDIMYREADYELKNKIKNNEKWRDIYLYLLTESYKNVPIKFSDMNEDNQAEMLFITKNSDVSNPVKIFNDNFSKDEHGWVSTEKIKEIMKLANLNDCKLAKFLKDRGCSQKKGSVIVKIDDEGNEIKGADGKVKKIQPQGYSGINLKENDENDN